MSADSQNRIIIDEATEVRRGTLVRFKDGAKARVHAVKQRGPGMLLATVQPGARRPGYQRNLVGAELLKQGDGAMPGERR